MTIERYARQTALGAWGAEGQARLAAGHVQVVEAGLGGGVCALYLAGAGIGRLTVPDGWVEACRALNRDVVVDSGTGPAGVWVVAGDEAYVLSRPAEASPVAAGARAARWAILRVLGS